MRWIENAVGLIKCQTPVWVWVVCKFCLVFPSSMRGEVSSILVGDPVLHTVLSFFQRSGVCPLFPAEKTLVKFVERIPVKRTAFWEKLIEKFCSGVLIDTPSYIFIDCGLFPLHKIRLFTVFDNKTFTRLFYYCYWEKTLQYINTSSRMKNTGQKL